MAILSGKLSVSSVAILALVGCSRQALVFLKTEA
jgi:hypothetical protein